MIGNCRYTKYEPLFGYWHIVKEIGSGAVGHVYEIERREGDNVYKAALKAITIPDGNDDVQAVLASGVARDDLHDYYQRIVRKVSDEYKYLARLKGCSYIVSYEDHEVIRNEHEDTWDILIKTELLKPLMEQAIESPLNEDEVIRLGTDICRALIFCGRYRIIHRDIKPENIFVSDNGDYKLGDFGTARVVEETQMNISRKGTLGYMAPEVFHGQAYGASADIYSLGILMYKYLNRGRDPFLPAWPDKIYFEDQENAFTKRMSGELIPEIADVDPEIARIVYKACAYEPTERYQTADEMLKDLMQLTVARGLHKEDNEDEEIAGEGILHLTSAEAGRSESPESADNLHPDAKNTLRRQLFSVAAIILIQALMIYWMIPKKVTDITGIGSAIKIHYDRELIPQYIIEPGWFEDEVIEFTSSDESVFTVDDRGVIYAVSVGKAYMTMKVRDYSEIVYINVIPKVTDIKNIENSYDLTSGDQIKLEPTLEPAEFASEKVTYKSGNDEIVKVNEEGNVTAISAGETTIIITAGGATTDTRITVTDPPVQSTNTYYQGTSGKNSSGKKKSKKSRSSSSSGSSGSDYFDSSDDEYF